MTQVASHIEGLSSLASQMHEQIRALIDHSGEKGRSSEHVVRAVLRAVLPKRFSIGTGIIVSSQGGKSRQTDIVVYDDFYNASPSLIGDVGVFPIECVYAAIEVKSWIDKAEIESCAEAIGILRGMKDHKYYRVPTISGDPATGSFTLEHKSVQNTIAPRTYLFAFDTNYVTIHSLMKALKEAGTNNGAHFHGVIVLSKGWFVKQRAFKTPPQFKYSETGGAKHFSYEMSNAINGFEMYPADMKRYISPPPLIDYQDL